MEPRRQPTTATPLRSSEGAADDARATAIAALIHRMNGALNNASMALELALGDASSDAGSAQILRTGVAAIAQASRAAALIAQLVNGRAAPGEPDSAYARDVSDLVREHARTRGGPLGDELDGLPADVQWDASRAARRLVEEIARLQSPASDHP